MPDTEVVYRSPIPAPPTELLAWHARQGAFERLTPPWMDVRVVAAQGTVSPGDWKRLRLGLGPAGISWTVAHRAGIDGPGFVDEQQAGPFRSWRHEHRFLPDGHGGSTLEDRIAYRLPVGPVGRLLAERRVRDSLDEVFRFRHRRTALDLARHADAAFERPQRIAITGASGLVGDQLVPFLRAGGHEVLRLVRRQPRGYDEIFWDPAAGRIDAAALEGIDAIVHLAAESIAAGRWTKKRKAAIRASRVAGTGLLARTLSELRQPPKVLVSASAVGYYGGAGNATLTEDSPAGEGFLAAVCRDWEAASAPAAAAGIRVVLPRFGIVLAGGGGLLARMAPLFRLGVGGRLGSGAQFVSWIGLDDLLGVILHAIADDGLSGPINATAPNPVTNREFAGALGRVLGRPVLASVPARFLRLAAGELADDLLLASQRVLPERLRAAGFAFAFPTLEDALRHELGCVGDEQLGAVHDFHERRGGSADRLEHTPDERPGHDRAA
jgi:uncharacterized protein (TIGR01777 family)